MDSPVLDRDLWGLTTPQQIKYLKGIFTDQLIYEGVGYIKFGMFLEDIIKPLTGLSTGRIYAPTADLHFSKNGDSCFLTYGTCTYRLALCILVETVELGDIKASGLVSAPHKRWM